MFRTQKELAMAVALVAATAGLPGCMLAVGSNTSGGDRRIHKLEERMSAAEQRLGIPSPEVAK